MKLSRGSTLLLAGGLLIAAWPNVAGSGAKVEAAAPSDGIVYYLAGTVNAAGSSEDIGWGAGNGSVQGLLESTWVDDEDKSEFDWADGYHEFVFDAVAGDMFKLVVNGSGWGSPWWMKFEEMFLNTSYFEPAESDGNVQVKEAGTYTLRFTHQYQSSSGTDKPWNIHVTGTVAEVSPENDYSVSVDGVLYSKDMTVLHTVPRNYDSSVFEIPDTVTVVDELAVNNCTMIGTLIVPASVTSMGLWSVHLPNMHTLVMEGTVPEEPWYWLEYDDSDRFDVYTDSPELFAGLADIGVATIHPLDEYVPEDDGGDVWILAAAVVTAMVVTGVVCGRRE